MTAAYICGLLGYISGMRCALPLLLVLFVVACSEANTAERPLPVARRAVEPPSVTTLSLPGEDGRVHIVTVPDRWQTSRCLVHVGTNGGGTIGCMQPTDRPVSERIAEP